MGNLDLMKLMQNKVHFFEDEEIVLFIKFHVLLLASIKEGKQIYASNVLH